MKLLLDAHVLLWAIYSPELLSKRVVLLLGDGANELLVSHASLWELLNKIGRGKLLLAGSELQETAARVSLFGVTLLPISYEDILAAAALPHHHSDPFDRMLIAHAVAYRVPIVTADMMLSRYMRRRQSGNARVSG